MHSNTHTHVGTKSLQRYIPASRRCIIPSSTEGWEGFGVLTSPHTFFSLSLFSTRCAVYHYHHHHHDHRADRFCVATKFNLLAGVIQTPRCSSTGPPVALKILSRNTTRLPPPVSPPHHRHACAFGDLYY